jgi:hypothetical protein
MSEPTLARIDAMLRAHAATKRSRLYVDLIRLAADEFPGDIAGQAALIVQLMRHHGLTGDRDASNLHHKASGTGRQSEGPLEP